MERPKRYGEPDQEKLDTTPVEMPLGYTRPTPLQDLIATMVRDAVQQENQEDFETLEEADDFEEEDPELLDMSRYELTELNEEVPLADLAEDPQAPEEPVDPPPNDQVSDPEPVEEPAESEPGEP